MADMVHSRHRIHWEPPALDGVAGHWNSDTALVEGIVPIVAIAYAIPGKPIRY
jgi:hypothetical protein